MFYFFFVACYSYCLFFSGILSFFVLCEEESSFHLILRRDAGPRVCVGDESVSEVGVTQGEKERAFKRQSFSEPLRENGVYFILPSKLLFIYVNKEYGCTRF